VSLREAKPEKQIPYGDDNKRSKGKALSPHFSRYVFLNMFECDCEGVYACLGL